MKKMLIFSLNLLEKAKKLFSQVCTFMLYFVKVFGVDD